MAKLSLASVKPGPGIVDLWRDFDPMPGEKPPDKLRLDFYDTSRIVAATPIVSAGKWTRWHLEPGSESDRLVEVLREGPVKVWPYGTGEMWTVDMDRIERAK